MRADIFTEEAMTRPLFEVRMNGPARMASPSAG